MTVLQTIAVALSMFSALPMPQFEWTTRNMRGALLAFPLIGIIIALLVWLWLALSSFLGFHEVLRAAGLVAIPILVTGGIHLDGFCDTSDAIASHAERERKLEIMKDSHTGAFAVIAVGVYLVLYLGFATQLEAGPGVAGPLDGIANLALCLGALYVLTRALSGFAVAAFPCAKDSGLAHTFSDMASRRLVKVGDALIALVVTGLSICLCGVPAAGMVLAVIIVFLIYRAMSSRLFGGITGDLAGWFLQIAELAGIAGIVIAQAIL